MTKQDRINSRPAELRELMARIEPGHALPQGFYTSQAVYEHDIREYWNRNWIWVGHECQIPEPGDYLTFDYGPESVIVVRDQQGEVRAHLNVCRHRGSRICTEARGKARVLVCPYHAWTFELSGKLRAARDMGPDFDPSKWGLFPAQVMIFEGLIFVCAAQEAPPVQEALKSVAELAAPMDLANMKVAHEASYPLPANWKLAVENYMECFHCAPAHLEYARSHTLKDPADVEKHADALAERSRAIGLPTGTFGDDDAAISAPGSGVFWRRYPLYDGYETGSETGAPLAPPLGQLTGCDGGATDFCLGTLNNFLIYADHAVGYRFVPRGLQETDIQIVWMVRADAEEGRDYDLEALKWLWHVTTLDDERIIRLNQAGLNSTFFKPGPLSPMETSVQSFYDDYLAMI